MPLQIQWFKFPTGAFSTCWGEATTGSLIVRFALSSLLVSRRSLATTALRQDTHLLWSDHPAAITLVCGYCLPAKADFRQPLKSGFHCSLLTLELMRVT